MDKLTVEQQFQLNLLSKQVCNLTHEQAVEFAVKLKRQMMIKDNLVRHLLKNA